MTETKKLVQKLLEATRRGDVSGVNNDARDLATQLNRYVYEPSLENEDILRGLSLLSEYYYLIPEFQKAQLYVEATATLLLRSTSNLKRVPSWPRDVQKQLMWLLAARAIVHFRMREYTQAANILDAALVFVEDHLVDEDYRCFGTLARLHYYRGLVCRNQGEFRRAERHFGVASEMAVLRRDNPESAEKHRTTEDREFTARCLARIQAFGIGLTHFGEGRLLLASLAFQTALELLAAQPKNAAAELMAMQVRVHQAVVQGLLAEFDENGKRTLRRALAGMSRDREVFGESEPYLALSKVTRVLIEGRLRADRDGKCNTSPDDLAITSEVVDTEGGDLIDETAGIVVLRCYLDAGTKEALEEVLKTCQLLGRHHSTVPFLRDEIRFCSVQASLGLLAVVPRSKERNNWIRNAKSNLEKLHANFETMTIRQQKLYQVLRCEMALVQEDYAVARLLWGLVGGTGRARKDETWRRKQALLQRHPLVNTAQLSPLPLLSETIGFRTEYPTMLSAALVGFNLICDAVAKELKREATPATAELRARVRRRLPDLDAPYFRGLFPWLEFLTDGDPGEPSPLAREMDRYLRHVANS